MQNKGFVKFLAVALTLICLFYLSFGFVTKYVEDKAAKMGEQEAELYLDSLNSTPFYLGNYTLKDCRETGIGLGLDLKGGMNVILEVSVPEVVKTLADHKTDEAFLKSVSEAAKEAQESQSDFITLFVKAYKKNAPGKPLATIFATQQLKGKVNTNSSDAEVEKVLRESVDEAVDNSFLVLRTRIDRFGVVQPNIQKIEGQSGRIMVELPGIKEPERVRKLLQGSANLEFWETYDAPQVAPYLSQLNAALRNGGVAATDSVQADTTAVAETEQVEEKVDSSKNATSVLAQVNKGDEAAVASKATEAAKKENPLFAMLQPTGAQRGCMVGLAQALDTAEINALLNSEVAKQIFPADLSLKWGVKSMDKAGKIFELYAIRTTGQNGRAPLEGEVVTEANVNHCVAVVLDNLVYSAPNVMNKIDGGNTQISGNFTTTETKDLANVLQSGKMPAPASIIQEDIVGPTLGAQSIQAGFISCIVAFIVLMLYMVLMYGVREGMVANCALILNFFFTFGILTSLGAALTMSGIAGMVLSLGTAVDANVLIYERTKEELAAGKGAKQAMAAGYSNAFSAIFDSNVTSVITGVILLWFGKGPIQGFATTWIIGIVCSFFSAVYLTRLLYESKMNHDKWLNLSFTTSISKNLMQGTHFHFMEMYKKTFTIAGIAFVVFIISFFTRGLSRSIDFTGGRNYVVRFEKPIQPEQVRGILDQAFPGCTNNALAIGTDGKTIRIGTNYKIESSSPTVDDEAENMLYTALKKNGLVSQKDVQAFKNPDIRAGGSIISSAKVGPSVASSITWSAIESVIFALIAIFLYILLRFRNWAFSAGSTIALAFDAMTVIGFFSLLYGIMPFPMEVDQTFIGAVLTVIGYSINDKVVVFDRIRENLRLHPKQNYRELFNDSINQTLARTINTSSSTLIVLLCILFLGGESIQAFAFAMTLGVIFGTISSIFIASPIAYLLLGRKAQKKTTKELATA